MKLTSGEGCARPTGAHSRGPTRGVLGRRSQLILVLLRTEETYGLLQIITDTDTAGESPTLPQLS
jgi:hypothetical protein